MKSVHDAGVRHATLGSYDATQTLRAFSQADMNGILGKLG